VFAPETFRRHFRSGGEAEQPDEFRRKVNQNSSSVESQIDSFSGQLELRRQETDHFEAKLRGIEATLRSRQQVKAQFTGPVQVIRPGPLQKAFHGKTT
jgi:hypothetical protein